MFVNGNLIKICVYIFILKGFRVQKENKLIDLIVLLEKNGKESDSCMRRSNPRALTD